MRKLFERFQLKSNMELDLGYCLTWSNVQLLSNNTFFHRALAEIESFSLSWLTTSRLNISISKQFQKREASVTILQRNRQSET